MANKLYKLELQRGYPQDQHHRAGLVLQRGGALITELSKDQLEAVKNDHYISLSEAKSGEQTATPPVSEGAGVASNASVGSDAPDRSASEETEVVEDPAAESTQAASGEVVGDAEEAVADEAAADDADVSAEQAAEDKAVADATAEEAAQEGAENSSNDTAETVDSLVRDHSREELNKIAVEAGVEAPELLQNKPEVAQAIIEKRA